MRFATDVDQFLTHKLGVYDSDGSKLLELKRPRKVFKSRLLVSGADGRDIGQITRENVFGKIRFNLLGAHGRFSAGSKPKTGVPGTSPSPMRPTERTRGSTRSS